MNNMYFDADDANRFSCCAHAIRGPRAVDGLLAAEGSKIFVSVDEMRGYGLELLAKATSALLSDQFQQAVEEGRVEGPAFTVTVTDDGWLNFLRALAAKFAPNVSFRALRWDDTDDCRR